MKKATTWNDTQLSAMGIINHEEAILPMPAPRNKNPTFLFLNFMISKSIGLLMEAAWDVLNARADDGASFKGILSYQKCGVNSNFLPLTMESEDANLLLWATSSGGSELEATLSAKVAMFGKPFDDKPYRVVLGHPISGCDVEGFKVQVRDSVVVVERGNCPFINKARNIQRSGGKGMILVDTRKKKLTRMPGGDNHEDVKLPSLMVRIGFVDWMKNIQGKFAIVRVVKPESKTEE